MGKLQMSGTPPGKERISPLAATFLAILEREIIWCEQNPDKAFSLEYRKGFVNGLIQARLLITKSEQVLRREMEGISSKSEDDHSHICDECGQRFNYKTYAFDCPHCGHENIPF